MGAAESDALKGNTIFHNFSGELSDVFDLTPENLYESTKGSIKDLKIPNYLNLDNDNSFLMDLFCHCQWLTRENDQAEALKKVIIPLFCRLQQMTQFSELNHSKEDFISEIAISRIFLEQYLLIYLDSVKVDQKALVVDDKMAMDSFSVEEFIKSKEKSIYYTFNSEPVNLGTHFIRPTLINGKNLMALKVAYQKSILSGDISTLLLILSLSFNDLTVPKENIIFNAPKIEKIELSSNNLIGRFINSCLVDLPNKSSFAALPKFLAIVQRSNSLLLINLSSKSNQNKIQHIEIPTTKFDQTPSICQIEAKFLLYTPKFAVLFDPKYVENFIIVKKRPTLTNQITSDGMHVFSLQKPDQVVVCGFENEKEQKEKELKIIHTLKLDPPLDPEFASRCSIVTNGVAIQFIAYEHAGKYGKGFFAHQIYVYSAFTGKLETKEEVNLPHIVSTVAFDPLTRNVWTIASGNSKYVIGRHRYEGPDSPAVTGYQISETHFKAKKPNRNPNAIQKHLMFIEPILASLEVEVLTHIGSPSAIRNPKNVFNCGGASAITKAINNLVSLLVSGKKDVMKQIGAINQLIRIGMSSLALLAQSNSISQSDAKAVQSFLVNLRIPELHAQKVYLAVAALPRIIEMGEYRPSKIIDDLINQGTPQQQQFIIMEIEKSPNLYKAIHESTISSYIQKYNDSPQVWRNLIGAYIRVLFRELVRDSQNGVEMIESINKIIACQLTNVVFQNASKSAFGKIMDEKSPMFGFLREFLMYSRVALNILDYAYPFLTASDEILYKIHSQLNYMTPDAIPSGLRTITKMLFANFYLCLSGIADMEIKVSLEMMAAGLKTIPVVDSSVTIEDVYNAFPQIRNKNQKPDDMKFDLLVYKALAHQVGFTDIPKKGNQYAKMIINKVYNIRNKMSYSKQLSNKTDSNVAYESRPITERYEDYKKLVESKLEYLLTHTPMCTCTESNLEYLKNFIIGTETLSEFKKKATTCENMKSSICFCANDFLGIIFDSFTKSYPIVVPFISLLIEEGGLSKLLDKMCLIKANMPANTFNTLYGKLLSLGPVKYMPAAFSIKAYFVTRALDLAAELPPMPDIDNGSAEETEERKLAKDLISLMEGFFKEYEFRNENENRLYTPEKIVMCCIQSLYNRKFPGHDWAGNELKSPLNTRSVIEDAALMIAGIIPPKYRGKKLEYATLLADTKNIHQNLILIREAIKIQSEEKIIEDVKEFLDGLGTVVCGCAWGYFGFLKSKVKDLNVHKQVAVEVAEMIRLLLSESSAVKELFAETIKAFNKDLENKVEIEDDNLFPIIAVAFVLSNTFNVKTTHEVVRDHGRLIIKVNDEVGARVPILGDTLKEEGFHGDSRQHMLPFLPSLFESGKQLITIFRSALQDKEFLQKPLLRYFVLHSLKEYIKDPNTSESFTHDLMQDLHIKPSVFRFSDSSQMFVDLIYYGIQESRQIGICDSPEMPKFNIISAPGLDNEPNEINPTHIEAQEPCVFMSTIISRNVNTSFDFCCFKKKFLNAGIIIHSCDVNMTKSIFYSSKHNAIIANRKKMANVPKHAMNIKFVYDAQNEVIRVEDGNTEMNIASVDMPKAAASFFIVLANDELDFTLTTEKFQEEKRISLAVSENTGKSDSGFTKTTKMSSLKSKETFYKIPEISQAADNSELPLVPGEVSYSGSNMPMEFGVIGRIPILHSDNYKRVPFDVITTNAIEITEKITTEILTILLSASLRYQLSETLSKFAVGSDVAVRFIMSVALMLENFKLDSKTVGVPFDLNKCIFDKSYKCENPKMLDHHESAMKLYNYLKSTNPNTFIEALTQQMESQFMNIEQHFVSKDNEYSKVITSMGKITLKPNTILIIGQFNCDDIFGERNGTPLRFYATGMEGEISITFDNVTLIALETDEGSNNFAIGTFLELAVFWKYAVLITNMLRLDLSSEVKSKATKAILKYFWWSVLAMSPFFINHRDELIKFVEPRISANSDCEGLLKETIKKVETMRQEFKTTLSTCIDKDREKTVEEKFILSSFYSYLNYQLEDISIDSTESVNNFFPEISGKPEVPDESTFEVPTGALRLKRNEKLITRVLKPVQSIRGFPAHLILQDWVEKFMMYPPVEVINEANPNNSVIKFTSLVPSQVHILPSPHSVYSTGKDKNAIACNNVDEDWDEEDLFPIPEGEQTINVVYMKSQSSKEIIVKAEPSMSEKEAVIKFKTLFNEDMKKWINFTVDEDQRILEIAQKGFQIPEKPDHMLGASEEEWNAFLYKKRKELELDQLQRLNDFKYPLYLTLLRLDYLMRFNFWQKRRGFIENDMVRFVSIKTSKDNLTEQIMKMKENNPLRLQINRARAEAVIENRSKDVFHSAIGQFASQYKDPASMRAPMRAPPLVVTFDGEEGEDAGGLTKGLITMITKEIDSENVGLFIPTPNARNRSGNNQHCIVPAPNIGTAKQHLYETIGAMLATLIRMENQQMFSFAPLFWKYLAYGSIDAEDIFEIDEEFRQHIDNIEKGKESDIFEKMKYENVVKSVDGTECILDDVRQQLTRQMARRYVTAAIKFRIEEMSRPLEWIRRGMWDNFGFECPSFVTPLLLQDLCCVESHISELEFKKRLKCQDQIIREWAISIFTNFTQEQRKKFLAFLTGSKNFPKGDKNNEIKIKVDRVISKNMLPIAHTCFNQLDIPQYESLDVFRNKLIIAVENSGDQFTVK